MGSWRGVSRGRVNGGVGGGGVSGRRVNRPYTMREEHKVKGQLSLVRKKVRNIKKRWKKVDFP